MTPRTIKIDLFLKLDIMKVKPILDALLEIFWLIFHGKKHFVNHILLFRHLCKKKKKKKKKNLKIN